MGRRPINTNPPTLEEWVEHADRWELALRRLIGRWHDSIPAQLRAQLTRPANDMERLLIRAGRR
jgi:hypothetical protein